MSYTRSQNNSTQNIVLGLAAGIGVVAAVYLTHRHFQQQADHPPVLRRTQGRLYATEAQATQRKENKNREREGQNLLLTQSY